MNIKKSVSLLILFFFLSSHQAYSNSETHSDLPEGKNISDIFFSLLINEHANSVAQDLALIKSHWQPNLIPMALETMRYSSSRTVRTFLDNQINQSVPKPYLNDTNTILEWVWNQKVEAPEGYANFKASLYQNIDPRFFKYFHERQSLARVRLDEMRWGGVVQDGIPPLRNPKMLSVKQATYLEDSNVVFGIEINGDARAYPKRILAWHEMFTDTIGGVEIAGVYCTLCGTVIPYRTKHKGKSYKLGTSGFLYRSNKMMYDNETQSLWSTTKGIPVLGPLVDQGIQLEYESVVTTTWGEWKRRHPNTTVLSLDTSHQRDYSEGNAYKAYFGTDQLMFNTPFNDARLKNKREVLALRFSAAPNQQLAIDTEFLNKHPIYTNNIGRQKFVVFTDTTGANRVYDPKGVEFSRYDGDQTVVDTKGNKWHLTESELTNSNGKKLHRLRYHRAFWFGWRAAFPETKLIK